MRDALDKAKARYDELTRQLEDPAVHSNPAELKRVSK
jgi:protein subunit release factor A